MSINITNIFDKAISKEKYIEWLSQFDSRDIPIVTTLVKHIKYFSLKRTEDSLVDLYNKIVGETKDIDKVFFIPVGYVVKSGAIVAYTFRKNNQVPENKFLPYTDLNNNVLKEARFIVFLDDFIGTGHQCCEVWRDFDRKFNTLVHKPTLIYATIVSTNYGKKVVEQKTSFKVLASCMISDHDIPLHETSKIFPNDKIRGAAKEVLSKYGKELYPKYPLGYKDNSLLVGFYYSTPNNTLPIFWSSRHNWKPLLTKGDDYRDPQFLVGPEINIPQNLTFKGFENSFVEDNILDGFDVDANTLIKLTQEFKNTKLLLIIVPVIQKLKLKEACVTELIRLINSLKNETHEHRNITSAMFIGEKGVVGGLKYYLKTKNTNISDTKSIVDLANQTNGYEDGIAIDNTGVVYGNFTYNTDSALHNYMPTKLQKAAAFTLKKEGLLVLFEGENRVNIIWKGQRLLSYRKSSWYLTPSNFERLNTILAQMHGVKKEAIDRLLTIAIEMTHTGEGGLVTIGDAEEVIKLSVKKPNNKVSAAARDITNFGIRQWINILSQDGASVFDNDGILIEYMATIRPPGAVDIELETGRGTKHQTAQIISHLTKSISIAISVDSNFTIYSKGKKVFRMNG